MMTPDALDAEFVARRDLATRAPNDAKAAFDYAHFAYITWRPAAALFRRAAALAPGHRMIIRGVAMALAAEGQGDAALAVLRDAVDQQPDWADGHAALARMCLAQGQGDAMDASYRRAIRHHPQLQKLWMGWFQLLCQARRWDAAEAVLADARIQLGDTPAVRLSAVYLASERAQPSTDPDLFDSVSAIDDPGLDICRVRFLLRTGQPEAAATCAARYLDQPLARSFWPYVALAWRLCDDQRALWLEPGGTTIADLDLAVAPDLLARLRARLPELMCARAPFLDQSVRGGIQTDRHLFWHPDPDIQQARACIDQAVRAYIDALPSLVPGHPLLGVPRGAIDYAGAWSVRLAPGGFHAPHTHHQGWISAVLYIHIPDAAGPPPAGWLALGLPPPELGLPVSATQQIAPQAGHLVLFPSTTWHGTLPFEAGVRQTIAFDVAIPRAQVAIA